jgi:hypothetical protein
MASDPTLSPVALHLTPDPGDPGEPQIKLGRVGGSDTAEERRLIRDGAQVLAHGALICPSCALPIAATRALPVGSEVRCGYSDHAATARAFLREDVYDTLVNEAYLVARIV